MSSFTAFLLNYSSLGFGTIKSHSDTAMLVGNYSSKA